MEKEKTHAVFVNIKRPVFNLNTQYYIDKEFVIFIVRTLKFFFIVLNIKYTYNMDN